MPLSSTERKMKPNRGDIEDVKTSVEAVAQQGAPITGEALESGGSGVLGWLSSVRKKLTEVRDRLPSSLGAKTTAQSLAVALPTDLAPFYVRDRFTSGNVNADLAGNGAAQTVSFAPAVQLVWVHAVGGEARADPFGGTPSATTGIRCIEDVPTPLFVETSSVKVFAPVGVTVTVWGARY